MKVFLSLLLSIAVLEQLFICGASQNVQASQATSYDYVQNALDIIFYEYPVGSFFTKNRKHCTCHSHADCIASMSDCNCMRYFPTGNLNTCEIDLLGVQCIGFARYCQYRIFGYIDYGSTADLFYNILGRSLYPYTWNASDAKFYIQQAVIGSHIRIGTHSMTIISVNENGFTTYECNSSVAGRECVVYKRNWTWASFCNSYGGSTWRYLNAPKQLPSLPDTVVTENPVQTTVPTPDIPDIPVTSEIPVITETPVVTEIPVITEAPAITEIPVITEAPPVPVTSSPENETENNPEMPPPYDYDPDFPEPITPESNTVLFPPHILGICRFPERTAYRFTLKPY